MPEPTALEGEPTFELMGRDPFAPALIRLWVAQRRQDVRNGVRPVADLDQIERAERTAERMETWRSEADEAWRSPKLPLARVDGTPGDKDGWISWGGGECPVTPTTEVRVCFRIDGEDFEGRPGFAALWVWEHHGRGGDIVRYRLDDQ